ncbi:MAG: hypothetical protein GTO40_04280, partial [Deltaproteobacteria bacterium]|nr:hypothetical protein [Deltaproteobacteria bacterium]
SLEYRYENHRLALTATGIGWSIQGGGKTPIQEGVEPVKGRLITDGHEVEGSDAPNLARSGVIYENAYGEGLHLGVLTKNHVFRKIVRFDRLESLGAIPQGAEVLEVGFNIEADAETTFRATFGGERMRVWDQRQTAVAQGEPVEVAKGIHQSLIQPAHAWDSAGDKIPLALEFRSEGGRLFLTKRIPVTWLKEAVFPIYADVDLTFYTEQTFHPDKTDFSNNNTREELTALESPNDSYFVVAYLKDSNPKSTRVIAGQAQSDNSIVWGSPTDFYPGASSAFAITAVDSTHFVLIYQETGGGAVAKGVVGTVDTSDKSITLGSTRSTFETTGADPLGVTSMLDGTHVVAAYRDGVNNGYALVGTITFGATPADHTISFIKSPTPFNVNTG